MNSRLMRFEGEIWKLFRPVIGGGRVWGSARGPSYLFAIVLLAEFVRQEQPAPTKPLKIAAS
jgi:hypothetical protein